MRCWPLEFKPNIDYSLENALHSYRDISAGKYFLCKILSDGHSLHFPKEQALNSFVKILLRLPGFRLDLQQSKPGGGAMESSLWSSAKIVPTISVDSVILTRKTPIL